MRVWIYGRNDRDIHAMAAFCADSGDTMIGYSIQKDTLNPFPQSGLTQTMQAAIRGELDLLLLPDLTLLGGEIEQIREMIETFRSYRVIVRSVCSSDSSSS